MSESEVFDILQKNYFILDQNFNKLFDACKTEEQRDQLRNAYVISRDNFWAARSRVFQQNDPLVANLLEKLKSDQALIENSLKNLQDIVQVLNLITAAIHIGSSLITLGSSL
jgi:hypothetical protein